MKYIVSTGDTGSHIYPALSLINKIKEKDKEAKFLYIGTTDRMEKDIVPNMEIDYFGIKMHGVSKNPKTFISFVSKFLKAKKQCKDIMKKFNKYSYAFTKDNTLIIMDNTNINSMLIKQLIINILLFIIFELIILSITYIIIKWIITPVKNPFEKQKIFIADASHELKTPLVVMIASADAYFIDKDDKWVHNMKSESERMTKLVAELLDLTKTEKEQEVIIVNNNLSDIIESYILTFEGLFYEQFIKNLKILKQYYH